MPYGAGDPSTPDRIGQRGIGAHHRGHGAQDILIVLEINKPVFQHTEAVVDQQGRGSKESQVPGPAKPLIALGAVGWNGKEVASYSPSDVLVELIQERLRAGEAAGALHVGVADYRLDGGQV